MKELVNDLGHYICLTLLGVYSFSFYLRWEQIYRASKGHLVTGLLTFVSYIVLLLVVAFAPRFVNLFVPIGLATTTIWLLFNSWYFYRYPTYQAWLKDPVPPQTFGMDTILGKYLIGRQNESHAWFGLSTKIMAVVAAFLFVLAFGFVQLVNSRADGDRRVSEVLIGTKKQSLANRDSVKAVVQSAVQDVIDTVQKGQDKILAKADSANRNATAAKLFAFKTADKVDALGKKTVKAGNAAERAYRGNIQIPQALRPTGPRFNLPPVVVPKPSYSAPKYPRGYGFKYQEDSTYYVKETNEPLIDTSYFARTRLKNQ